MLIACSDRLYWFASMAFATFGVFLLAKRATFSRKKALA